MEFQDLEVWFVTGSQHLYGDEALKQVAEHAQRGDVEWLRRHGTVYELVDST